VERFRMVGLDMKGNSLVGRGSQLRITLEAAAAASGRATGAFDLD